MFYDLNVPWTANQAELQRTLGFLVELGYNVVALNHTIAGKLPADLASPILTTLLFPVPPTLRILTRCTFSLTDPCTNNRLAQLSQNYSILALRPTTERALLLACQSLECDFISLDLSVRFPFHFKHKTLSIALQRGVKFEICYAPGMLVVGGDGATARRNLIQNATELIRATRGRGLVISSEAKRALACRGPWDVINLASVWGLGQEKGRDAVGSEARSVVLQAEMKRRSFRGVVDIIYGGEKPEDIMQKEDGEKSVKGKRKADSLEKQNMQREEEAKPLSKREQKRQTKKARLGGSNSTENKAEALLGEAAVSPAPSQRAPVEPVADAG
ncbi:MAG: ribonuclease p complex subunit [Lasallia pustulata]|uniref:Ribonuclease p complex subunit n=1 Tax=Lasallia pustulata TaxID=136370 RepID=A0A5M8Q3X7_9LECA|nr:MAG: ribonuclease p complex subunit [Lasallia pustulata]